MAKNLFHYQLPIFHSINITSPPDGLALDESNEILYFLYPFRIKTQNFPISSLEDLII